MVRSIWLIVSFGMIATSGCMQDSKDAFTIKVKAHTAGLSS